MSNQVTLFQNETGAGPSQRFAVAGVGLGGELGEGIRSSYGIVSIKASRFRIKYKGAENMLMGYDQGGQQVPVSSIEVVIVKANPFLNKQYYEGKYAEGANAAPDCYSLDGKTPSAQVQHPVHANCTLCPKNQFGSLISETGVKQKACRDTKKLAIVPLADLRNEALGGPMLFRVPPSSLKDLSSLADAMKARGFPYNSVAVRIGFDMEASHPKPTFKAIRPLTDDEAGIILELYNGDGVAAVLADNEVVPDAEAVAPAGAGQFEVEAAGTQQYQAPQQPAPVQQPAAPPVAEQVGPTTFAAPPPPGPVPGMHGASVTPFVPGAQPPTTPAGAFAQGAPQTSGNVFTQPVQQPPAMQPVQGNPFAAAGAAAPVVQQQQATAPVAAAPKPRAKPKPVVETPQANPVQMADSAEPSGNQLDEDISSLLAGLSNFTSK